jgi:pimeloyl-ACP methyl ester carboxylesterase
VIVVDASALLEFLLQSPLGSRVEGRLLRDEDEFHSPHLIDVEVTQALRRLVRAGADNCPTARIFSLTCRMCRPPPAGRNGFPSCDPGTANALSVRHPPSQYRGAGGNRRRVMTASILAGLAAALAFGASGVYLRYRRDMNAARARLAAVDRHVASTRWGAVEYAERGSGNPVLVVHGIFHNCVGGLLTVREFSDRRFIAASRFGYLGSSMPPGATPADQADALAALLDALDIDRIDVIGESAGATSALQLVLRHPERVKHLAVLVGNLPGSRTAVVQPSWAKLFNRQLPLWGLWTFAPSMMIRLVAGLPKGFAMSSADVRFVTEFIDSLFPVSPAGVDFDAFVSDADVNDYDLEAITVPTLIVHTKDDQVASHEASKRAAQRIPGARFVSLESGGHLMIGQTNIVGDELTRFFAEIPRFTVAYQEQGAAVVPR